jgi:hypothetical protein
LAEIISPLPLIVTVIFGPPGIWKESLSADTFTGAISSVSLGHEAVPDDELTRRMPVVTAAGTTSPVPIAAAHPLFVVGTKRLLARALESAGSASSLTALIVN